MPAKAGDLVCYYTQAAPLSEEWEIYSVLGERVATLSFMGGQSGCWDTHGVGKGLYFVKIKTTLVGGTVETQIIKAVIK
jgi:hypothetical protein